MSPKYIFIIILLLLTSFVSNKITQSNDADIIDDILLTPVGALLLFIILSIIIVILVGIIVCICFYSDRHMRNRSNPGILF